MVPVDYNEVLEVVKGTLTTNGVPLTEVEVLNLQQEVKALKSFRIWRLMQETLRQKAIEKGFLGATDWEQVLSGKMMVHSLGTMQSLVDVVERYKFPHTTQPVPRKPV